jgi:hypothetical protein
VFPVKYGQICRSYLVPRLISLWEDLPNSRVSYFRVILIMAALSVATSHHWLENYIRNVSPRLLPAPGAVQEQADADTGGYNGFVQLPNNDLNRTTIDIRKPDVNKEMYSSSRVLTSLSVCSSVHIYSPHIEALCLPLSTSHCMFQSNWPSSSLQALNCKPLRCYCVVFYILRAM